MDWIIAEGTLECNVLIFEEKNIVYHWKLLLFAFPESYGMQVDDMRGRIFFPKLGQMNLTQFFEQITYSLKDTINYLSITTGARMPGNQSN